MSVLTVFTVLPLLTFVNLGAAMSYAVPIRVVDEYGTTVPGMVAVFYWLEPSGRMPSCASHQSQVIRRM